MPPSPARPRPWLVVYSVNGLSRTLLPDGKTRQGQALQPRPQDPRYTIVNDLVTRALAVFDSEHGRDTLVQVADDIIKAREDATNPQGFPAPEPHIYRPETGSMRNWVGFFLSRLRGCFPEIDIKRIGKPTAVTNKKSWGLDMAAYNPHNAAVIELNGAIIENMLRMRGTQHQRTNGTSAYEILEFEMTVSVAHEIVHLLTGFLTGANRPNTPYSLAPTGYAETMPDGETRGEIGWYWENLYLGGILEFWTNPTDPLGNNQAGTPYLFEEQELPDENTLDEDGFPAEPEDPIGFPVTSASIRAFLGYNFSPLMLDERDEATVDREYLVSKGRMLTGLLRVPATGPGSSSAAGAAARARARTDIRQRRVRYVALRRRLQPTRARGSAARRR
ncbi:hypothetical protein C8A05DRAFT_39475 [Staphylotrichum tortipilum]|uniref:Uncharacterized protein n=1 Tax=Staphylotrichum tortipilum TaxID=2831512 RepID=A0AAN6RNA7_9PEZI|nr:hypothetical protein C8A05DRAFT_39475 [Staphylotrichum longicolle]